MCFSDSVHLLISSFISVLRSVHHMILCLCFDFQGEWLLLFNYLIPFSELLDQSGQALDCEGGGARVNIKTEQVGAS